MPFSKEQCFDSNEKNLSNEATFNEIRNSNRPSPLPWLYNFNDAELTEIDHVKEHHSSQQLEDNYYAPTNSQTFKRTSLARSNSLLKNRSIRRQALYSGKKMAKLNNQNCKQDGINLNSFNLNNINNNNNNYDEINKLSRHQSVRKKRIWHSLRYKAKNILPTVRDINIIDKYSRMIFPSLFLIFNICYWCFYFVQSTFISKIANNLH